jgi:ABC-type branched-subunit amino acid transport system substrate-binding protein
LTYTDVNTQGPSQKALAESERVSAAWINAHGGIAGRPLDAKFCDSRGTPTAAAACAREAVADKAIAVVGSFSFTGDAIVPILQAAHVALFGNCCAESAAELSSPTSFPLGNEPLWELGLLQKAVQQGCKHITPVLIAGAEGSEPLLSAAAKTLGTKLGNFVILPAQATDYSPQVAQATSGGADCLIMVVAETAYAAWMPAYAQAASHPKMYGPQGNFDEKVVKGFQSLVEGGVVGGSYPPISLPAWANFSAALKTYHADPGQDYNGLGGLGTWAAFQAFKQIVEGMHGPINNETFLTALTTAKVNLPGMLPPEDLSKPWGKDGGPKAFGRIFDRCVAFGEFHSGAVVGLGNTFTDVSRLAGGSKPMDCGSSFG